MRSLPVVLALVALGAAAGCATAPGPTDAERGPTPPPFSRRITSAFPATPLVTCDLGHHDMNADGSSAPQRWYVRPGSTGGLRIDAYALGGNPAEAGTLVVELFDPRGVKLADTRVTFPSGAPAPRPIVGSLLAPVAAASIHRLEVVLVPEAGKPQAHHYRLGFSGVPVEVGMNSPALPRWLEGLNFGRQLLHVHLDPGEQLRLAFSAGEGQPVPSFTIELRDESGEVLFTTTWLTRDPFEAALPALVGARTVRVVTYGNHHFALAKVSGTDRGIYFDACPPPGWR